MNFDTPIIDTGSNPKKVTIQLKYCDGTRATAFELNSIQLGQVLPLSVTNGLSSTSTGFVLGGNLTQPTTISAFPGATLTIQGQTGLKALNIVGDLKVTGVIDPVELQFSGNPITESGYRITALEDNPIYISPFVDRTNAVEFRKADDITPVVAIDTINGKLVTTGLQLPTGAVAGHILVSDATGNSTWQAPVSGGTPITADSGLTLTGSNIQLGGRLLRHNSQVITKKLIVGDVGYDAVNAYKNYYNFIVSGGGNFVLGTDPDNLPAEYVTKQQYDNGKMTIINHTNNNGVNQPYSCLYIGNNNPNTSRGIFMDWSNPDPDITVNSSVNSKTSALSDPCSFEINTSAVDAPIISVNPVYISGGATRDTTPTLSGFGIVGATITINQTTPAVVNYTTVVSSDGAWTFTFPALVAGTYTYSVKQTVGVTDSVSIPYSFVLDPLLVDVPYITKPFTPTCGGSTSDTTPTISGKGIPGSTITLTRTTPTALVSTVITNGTGAWTYTIPVALANGDLVTYTLKQTVVGVDSASTPVCTFNIDTSISPEATIVKPITQSCGGVTNTLIPKISGTGVASSIITINVAAPNAANYYAKVGTDGTWEFTFPVLTNGNVYTYTVKQTSAGTLTNYWQVQNYIKERGVRGFYWEIQPTVTGSSYIGRIELRADGVTAPAPLSQVVPQPDPASDSARARATRNSEVYGNGTFTGASAPYGLAIEQYGPGHGLLLVGNKMSYDTNYGTWLNNDYQSIMKIANRADKKVPVVEWSNNGILDGQYFLDFNNSPLTNSTAGSIKITQSSLADGVMLDLSHAGSGRTIDSTVLGSGGFAYVDNAGVGRAFDYTGRKAGVPNSTVINSTGYLSISLTNTEKTDLYNGVNVVPALLVNGSEAIKHTAVSPSSAFADTENFVSIAVGQPVATKTLPDPDLHKDRVIKLYKENVADLTVNCSVLGKIKYSLKSPTVTGTSTLGDSVLLQGQYKIYEIHNVPSGANRVWLIIEI